MAQIVKGDKTFTLLDEIQAQYPELIKLVIATESMDDNERQYWLDILPSMSDEQIDRLFNILDTERRQLEELDQKYQDEVKKLNDKQLVEWQEMQTKKARAKIAEKEASDKQGTTQADDVLNLLDTL